MTGDVKPYRGGPVQPHELEAFLGHYVDTQFNFREACRRIDRNPRTIYRIMERDEEFAERFAFTKRMVADVAFAEAVRRAVSGVEEPVYHQGVCVDHVTKFSDMLLAKLLEATHPDFKRKSSVEVSGPGGRPIEFNDTTVATKVAAILAAAKHRMIEGECEDVTDRRLIEQDDDIGDLL